MSKNAFFSHLKSADFKTFCDWSTSPWRNNLDTPWCNNLVCNNLDDVITLWCHVKMVTPQGHVLFTAFGKLMFEYIFWYQVIQWFLNDIAQKFWKIMGFQKMINSHDVQLVNCLKVCCKRSGNVVAVTFPRVQTAKIRPLRPELRMLLTFLGPSYPILWRWEPGITHMHLFWYKWI